MLTYADRFQSARVLSWWTRTFPDRRWWTDGVLAIGYLRRKLRGDTVSPKLAEQCERVRWQLIGDMCGGGDE